MTFPPNQRAALYTPRYRHKSEIPRMFPSISSVYNRINTIEKRLRIIKEEIYEKNNLQKNILNIMELYDIFSPILKEKYVIEKIINMKCDMELCKLRQEKEDLEKEIEQLRKRKLNN